MNIDLVTSHSRSLSPLGIVMSTELIIGDKRHLESTFLCVPQELTGFVPYPRDESRPSKTAYGLRAVGDHHTLYRYLQSINDCVSTALKEGL